MDSTSDHRQRDYLFDLQGYLVLKGALSECDLAAMNRWLDIGPGDGATVLVPGSHKAAEVHPRLELEGKPITAANHERQGAGNALGMREVHLRAGDVLLFTDAVTHGSAERTNPGFRRTVLYRYSPRYVRTRFNYQLSPALRARLPPERRAILEPVAPRSPHPDTPSAQTRLSPPSVAVEE